MRVDFYVLSEDAPDARLRWACRLAEQAAEQGSRVYLQTADNADARRLDELLWTYNDRSFLPLFKVLHACANQLGFRISNEAFLYRLLIEAAAHIEVAP